MKIDETNGKFPQIFGNYKRQESILLWSEICVFYLHLVVFWNVSNPRICSLSRRFSI